VKKKVEKLCQRVSRPFFKSQQTGGTSVKKVMSDQKAEDGRFTSYIQGPRNRPLENYRSNYQLATGRGRKRRGRLEVSSESMFGWRLST
jgi:hypothetical protein